MGVDANDDKLDAPTSGQRMDVTIGIPRTSLVLQI
jgi:hypothetical protein